MKFCVLVTMISSCRVTEIPATMAMTVIDCSSMREEADRIAAHINDINNNWFSDDTLRHAEVFPCA
jgi:hypothetical protein